MKTIFDLIFEQAKFNNENIVALAENLNVVNDKVDRLLAIFETLTHAVETEQPTASGTAMSEERKDATIY